MSLLVFDPSADEPRSFVTSDGPGDILLFDVGPSVVREVPITSDLLLVDDSSRKTLVVAEDGTDVIVISSKGSPGPPGPPGPAGAATRFEYQMPTAQTTATVEHNLGYDPVAVQVIGPDGHYLTDYDITVLVPGGQIRLGFDISVAALIRLM